MLRVRALEVRTRPSGLNAVPAVLVYIVLALIPVFSPAGLLLQRATVALFFVIAVYCIQFVWRYVGSISVAHAGLVGVGAYAAAISATRWDLPFWAGLLIGIGVVVPLSAVLGLVSLRTQGIYFVVVTWGATLIFGAVESNLISVTGGDSGLTVVSAIDLGPFSLRDGRSIYLALLVLAALCAVAVVITGRTLVGKRLLAARDNNVLARSLGLRAFTGRVTVFALSSIPASIAGAFYAYYQFHVSPDLFTGLAALQFVIMFIVGGVSSAIGPVVGAAIVIFLPDYLSMSPSTSQIVYGALLILVMIALPDGVAKAPATGLRLGRRIWWMARADRASDDA